MMTWGEEGEVAGQAKRKAERRRRKAFSLVLSLFERGGGF